MTKIFHFLLVRITDCLESSVSISQWCLAIPGCAVTPWNYEPANFPLTCANQIKIQQYKGI